MLFIVSYSFLANMLSKVGKMLAINSWYIIEYSRKQDQIGLDSKEIISLSIILSREVCWLIRIIYLRKKNIKSNIFIV